MPIAQIALLHTESELYGSQRDTPDLGGGEDERGGSFLWPLITQLVTFLCTFEADEPTKCMCVPPRGGNGGMPVFLVIFMPSGGQRLVKNIR